MKPQIYMDEEAKQSQTSTDRRSDFAKQMRPVFECLSLILKGF